MTTSEAKFEPYAAPKSITSAEDCYFYHTVTFDDGESHRGEWDLEKGVDEYLGHVEFRGKRVLDVGAANGYLTFAMEKRGASVVSYDLDENSEWDVVPYPDLDTTQWLSKRREHIRKLNNAYWYTHRRLGSSARMSHGSIYRVPKELGQFDIVVVGSLLLHLQDPWGALRSVASIAQDKLIVTEKLPRKLLPLRFLSQSFFGKLDLPCMVFLPDAKRKVPVDAWWFLAPGAIKRMLAVLGFGHAKVTFHSQPYQGEKIQMFTVVAKRAAPLPSLQ